MSTPPDKVIGSSSDVFRFDGGIGRWWALGHQAHWSERTRVRG